MHFASNFSLNKKFNEKCMITIILHSNMYVYHSTVNAERDSAVRPSVHHMLVETAL